MKKTIISLLAAAAAITGFVACDTDAEPLNLQPAYQYSEEYYANLRAYKESDHSICYLWFADYGVPSSPAYRFAGIPDSVDIVSLWGGYSQEGNARLQGEVGDAQQEGYENRIGDHHPHHELPRGAGHYVG